MKMEREIKIEIIKMFIPVIGVWWVIARIIPGFKSISWWDIDDKAIPLMLFSVLYQAICCMAYKYVYINYIIPLVQ